MPVWLIEFFASEELNRLFWLVTASTAPFWILLIFFPRAKFTRQICHPWIAPSALGIVYLYLLFLTADMTGWPSFKGIEMFSVRKFWGHPILFIALWMHKMALDLFLGIMMLRYAKAKGWFVHGELVLTWIFGPLGALAFSIRFWSMALWNWWKRRQNWKGKK